jgi:hypothetical protein
MLLAYSSGALAYLPSQSESRPYFSPGRKPNAVAGNDKPLPGKTHLADYPAGPTSGNVPGVAPKKQDQGKEVINKFLDNPESRKTAGNKGGNLLRGISAVCDKSKGLPPKFQRHFLDFFTFLQKSPMFFK